MRISDWSSDVCSSDLLGLLSHVLGAAARPFADLGRTGGGALLDHSGRVSGVVTQVHRDLLGLRHQLIGLGAGQGASLVRSDEHTSELQSLMRISYAVFCLKKK